MLGRWRTSVAALGTGSDNFVSPRAHLRTAGGGGGEIETNQMVRPPCVAWQLGTPPENAGKVGTNGKITFLSK